MDGRTPISQNLNGTTMSCLNYAKISCMEGTREILGCAVICVQPDGPQGFQKHPLSREKGEGAWNSSSRLQSSQVEAAISGCGAGQCLNWFESHLRDAEIPMVGANTIRRQGHIPSHVL